MKFERLLRNESRLLSAFRKYLPHEKGFVLKRANELVPELPLDEETIEKYYPEFKNLLTFQKALAQRYFAFLLAIEEYERLLKEKEYEGDEKRAQLIDQRNQKIALQILRESKRGRKPLKREKIEKYRNEIKALRRQGFGVRLIAKFLFKAHRLKVSPEYLRRVLKEWGEE